MSRVRAATAATVALAGLAVPVIDWTTSAGAVGGTVSGLAFVDFNDNGVRDTAVTNGSAVDNGLAGVAVSAYDATGAQVATGTTGADGTYSLNVANASSNALRVELATPAGYQPGFHGTSSGTNVQFVTLGATNVNAGFLRPGDFCQNNPTLASTCFRFGAFGSNAANAALFTFPYDAGAPGRRGDPLVAAHTAGRASLTTYDKIGATYGLAYQRSTKTLFAGAFTKVGTGFGPGGNDAIYRITDTGAVSTLINLDTVLGAGALGPNPRGASGWDYKRETPQLFNLVGKTALGDIDIAEDGSTLYTVDLAGKQLVEIPISGNPPTAGTVLTRKVPTPSNCAASDVQPFGLGVQGTTVYLGMVCSAESTQSRANLRAYVYAYDAGAHAFAATPALEFSLNFARGCGEGAIAGTPSGVGTTPCQSNADQQSFWRPWISTTTSPVPARDAVYAQPELADLVFDNGNLILAFRDRYGDQLGLATAGPNFPTDANVEHFANGYGDLMRACGTPASGWTLETGASCGGVTTGGTAIPPSGVAQGPGNGEYYFQDNASPDPAPITVPRHDEAVFGGAVQVPGYPQVAVNTFEPIAADAGNSTSGVRWMSNATGADQRAFELYNGQSAGSLAKANGLGDLEALCDLAPLQLGNRVWRDTNGNGVQDADEPGIAGVTVHLVQGSTAVGTAVTTADGSYYFDSSNVPGGVLANTAYTIKVDNPADSAAGGPLTGLALTTPNASGVPSNRNSDATAVAGIPTITVTTGGPGASNHDLDIGFSPPIAPQLACLGDFVWQDTNSNGVQDAGESGVSGVTVTLFDANGVQLATQQTDQNGNYKFCELPAGTYTIGVTPPAGSTLTTLNSGSDKGKDSDVNPTTGKTVSITLTAGQTDLTWDAGLVPTPTQLASLGDRVWLDANANGVQDAGENGVPGVTVTLFNSFGTAIATTTTDANGIYGFTNLAPETYSVGFTLPGGFKFTKRNAVADTANDSDADTTTGKTASITLAAGQNDLTWDAGIFQPACLGDTIWQDTNKNGIQDDGEPGVSGVTVTLLDAAGNVIGTQTTDAKGNYKFCDLTPGGYVVGVTPPAGSSLTSLNSTSDKGKDSDINPTTGRSTVVTLTSGQTDLTWDAGIVSGSTPPPVTASLGDFVWFDTNANGVQDGGEAGVPGVTVTLYDSSGAPVATSTTDSVGHYEFTGLTPGTYSVGFTRPPGFTFSPTGAGSAGTDSNADVSTGRTTTITLTAGQNDVTWDAGLYRLSSLGDVVWVDSNANGVQDIGEPGIAAVNVFLLNGSGAQIGATVTNVNGGYQFTDLPAGTYQVRFEAPPGYNFTSSNTGSDDQVDSDADATSGLTAQITLPAGVNDPTWDAGVISVAVSPRQVLPATGLDLAPLLAAACGLTGAGFILLGGSRRRRPIRVFR